MDNNMYNSDKHTFAKKIVEKVKQKLGLRRMEYKEPWGKKRIIITAFAAVFLSVLIGSIAFAYSVFSDPMGQFDTVAKQVPSAEPSKTPSPAKSVQPTPEPEIETAFEPLPTEDPYNRLLSQADLSILNNIVNIMLIGVDYAQERETWSGKKAYHADVMIILSINTDTKDVNLISLPRDTYAKIPGIDGIYKLNASIDCGGGWPKESGFEKVCESASWMLGGIPVQYYYAVDMAAVKGLVDAIGGVDFDVDFKFKIQGRSYAKGIQHMGGQAVLDYMRVRKHIGSESGDLNRINRQKNMLVAIFEKVKSSDMLVDLPQMLGAFGGNLYTNTTLAQTAGLASFFYNINSDQIDMHSMDGKQHNIFNWNFVITDQQKRVKLIKKIYGIDVPENKKYAYSNASHLWEQMQAKVIAQKSKTVLGKAKKILDADALLPEPTTDPTPTSKPTPTQTTEPTQTPPTTPEPTQSSEAASESPKAAVFCYTSFNADSPSWIDNVSLSSVKYRKYGSAVRELYNRAQQRYKKLLKIKSASELRAANNALKADIEELCRILSISKPSWRVNYEKGSNEIYVDFN